MVTLPVQKILDMDTHSGSPGENGLYHDNIYGTGRVVAGHILGYPWQHGSPIEFLKPYTSAWLSLKVEVYLATLIYHLSCILFTMRELVNSLRMAHPLPSAKKVDY